MAGFSLYAPELVGFLLMAGAGSLEAGGAARDCVFLSAPATPAMVWHPLNVFLTEYRAVEFRCFLHMENGAWHALVEVNSACQMRLRCAPGARGNWRLERDGALLQGECGMLDQA